MSDSLTARLPELTMRARAAQANAYAPYSGFKVGAALVTRDGTVFGGCNVENAAYPAGTCAERAALAAAVSAGYQQFEAVVIVSDATSATPPCGICRQMLAEFGVDLAVVAVTKDGTSTRWTLLQLLPDPFTPISLRTA
jgi:cytidine deaminase